MDWDKISKYILEEMAGDEKSAFEQLMNDNPEYRKAVSAARKSLHVVDAYRNREEEYNTGAAWNKLKTRLEETRVQKQKSRFRLLQYAAAVAVLLVSVTVGYVSLKNNTQTVLADGAYTEAPKEVVLPDGTHVMLNAGAKIVYPKRFKGNERCVEFSGEGFFTVVRDTEKPFVIKANAAEIKVLGTSFNLNSNAAKTEVLVTTGRVQLAPIKNNAAPILLARGQLGYLQNRELVKNITPDKNITSWHTQVMVFEKTPLSEVFRVVEKTYRVKVRFPENIADTLLLTSTFEKEPLEIILESIGKSFNLTYQINGSEVEMY